MTTGEAVKGGTLELAGCGIALMVCLSEEERDRNLWRKQRADEAGGLQAPKWRGELQEKANFKQDVQDTEVNRSVREIDSFESELDSFECGQTVEVSAAQAEHMAVRETVASGQQTERRSYRFSFFWGAADISLRHLSLKRRTSPQFFLLGLP